MSEINAKCKVEVQRPQVTEQLAILQEVMGSLLDRAETLRNRLYPVLGGQEEAASGIGGPVMALVPVASCIADERYRAAEVLSILTDILSRLEV